jgi:uncharacterized protein (DUF362 family)
LSDVRLANTVAASIDPVAIDAFGATIFGMAPDDLAHVRLAFDRGLGEKNLSEMSVMRENLS